MAKSLRGTRFLGNGEVTLPSCVCWSWSLSWNGRGPACSSTASRGRRDPFHVCSPALAFWPVHAVFEWSNKTCCFARSHSNSNNGYCYDTDSSYPSAKFPGRSCIYCCMACFHITFSFCFVLYGDAVTGWWSCSLMHACILANAFVKPHREFVLGFVRLTATLCKMT